VLELDERPLPLVANAIAGAPRTNVRPRASQPARPLVEHPLERRPRAIGAQPDRATGETPGVGSGIGIDFGRRRRRIEHRDTCQCVLLSVQSIVRVGSETMRAEVVVDGIVFGEGPVWVPEGTPGGPSLVVTSVPAGALYRIWPDEQRFEQLAETGGGANGAALAADGSILVTQNGGMDFSKLPIAADFPYREATPGLQLATLDGTVRYVANDGFQAPNDLVVAADGTVYFTDPPHYPPPSDPVGRVMAYSRDGKVRVVADGFMYCNGIALDRDGALVVIEARGLQRIRPDGGREWIVEVLGGGGGDGFCLDVEGNYYVAATVDHGVRVVDPSGKELDFLVLDGNGVTTNCCFGGADGRTLFATDAMPGRVVVWEGLPHPGLPLHAWPGPH
jgi:gluconolactonase